MIEIGELTAGDFGLKKFPEDYLVTTAREGWVTGYLDVTRNIKNIMGDFVEQALLEIYSDRKDYFTNEEFLQDVFNYIRNNKFNENLGDVSFDGKTLLIKLINGKCVQMGSSEWGHIERGDWVE